MSEILRAIPHREPFLFVDRIVERAPDALVTEWTVPADAPFLRGHYPGHPIVPGVLLCEFAFQSGAILCAEAAAPAADLVPVLARIAEARFKRQVGAGQTLRCEVSVTEREGPARRMRARVSASGERVLQVEFVVMLARATAASAPAHGAGAAAEA